MVKLFRMMALSLPLFLASLLGGVSHAQDHILHAVGKHFELDGKPFQIISGAIHYPRVPRAYWRDRLRKARAMGLNTVETYVFWNVHETTPGQFDFSGEKDLAEFIREAQQEGLYVILRPGPYVCAEWEFGGYPAWLLKNPSIHVRTSDPVFMAAAGRWMHRLGQEVAPLQSGNGGPILAVQVENEYGSFGADHAYMESMRRLLLDSGFNRALLYTADGAAQLPAGSLPELPAAINFGTGDAKAEFARAAAIRPTGPRMCGEYWAGWFDHWGEHHHTGDARREAEELRWMLVQGYSVNLYMFHGGTSFGWMNGANGGRQKYEPDVSSYDYDAPVGESGELTPKYFLFRDVIQQVTGKSAPAPPAPIVAHAFAPVPLARAVPLWKALPAPRSGPLPEPMENFDQDYGYILYRTSVDPVSAGDGGKEAALSLGTVHSYAQVYVDGVLAGTVDRRLAQGSVPVRIAHKGTRLDILVENTGRINFGPMLPGERAGLLGGVTLAGRPLGQWQTYPLPMRDVGRAAFGPAPCSGACFYRAMLRVDRPSDTFLDTRTFGKGMVWVNGRPLGRFWNIGPQGALYLPASWLKAGENEVVIFDLLGGPGRTLSFAAKPVLDYQPQP